MSTSAQKFLEKPHLSMSTLSIVPNITRCRQKMLFYCCPSPKFSSGSALNSSFLVNIEGLSIWVRRLDAPLWLGKEVRIVRDVLLLEDIAHSNLENK